MVIKRYVSVKNFLFFSAFLLYMTVSILSMTFFQFWIKGLIVNSVLIFCVALLLIKELLFRKFTKTAVLLSGLVFLTVVILIITQSTRGFNSILYLLLFFVSARDINTEKLCRYSFAISLFLFILVVFSAENGIIINYSGMTAKGFVNYLGFRYGLYASSVFSNIVLIRLYLKMDHISWFELAIWIGLSVIFFHLTISRLIFFILAIALFFVILMKKIRLNNNTIRMCAHPLVYSYVIIMLFSVYSVLFYDENVGWMRVLNLLLEGRLSMQNRIIILNGLTKLRDNIIIVGNALNDMGEHANGSYLYADNLFINMILNYGIITVIAFTIIITIALQRAYQNGDYKLVFIMSLLAFHGLVDDLVQYLFFNSFYLIIASSLYKYPMNVRRINPNISQAYSSRPFRN